MNLKRFKKPLSNLTYPNYANASDLSFVSKGTLENVITGKGLVSNTDYATTSSGGVIKVSNTYGSYLDENGVLRGYVKNYTDYQSAYNSTIISKGTLNNVLTATIGDIASVIDAINGESI